jgi:hypothetical protein
VRGPCEAVAWSEYARVAAGMMRLSRTALVSVEGRFTLRPK